MNAHSHFAFAGWISQALMVLMVNYLASQSGKNVFDKYRWVFIANLLTAYGMLLSFPWQGYNSISIIFSTLSIFVSYAFAFRFWKDISKLKFKSITHYWFSASLFFNVISSAGPFFLAYMMANHWSHPNLFLLALYYFLHFQYNGWFFFACMGLLNDQLKSVVSYSLAKKVFWLFALACIPAYFLSALWLPIPMWVYIVVVLAAGAQLLGWILILRTIIYNRPRVLLTISGQTKLLFIFSATALSIKLLLQLGSTIPFLSKLAFGFRPVVIGYLHLMFLGVISLFIIGFCKMNKFIITTRAGNTGITFFVSGIILNEILLMIQGLSYMNYITVPGINELLLGAAICMFCGVLILHLGLKKKKLPGP